MQLSSIEVGRGPSFTLHPRFLCANMLLGTCLSLNKDKSPLHKNALCQVCLSSGEDFQMTLLMMWNPGCFERFYKSKCFTYTDGIITVSAQLCIVHVTVILTQMRHLITIRIPFCSIHVTLSNQYKCVRYFVAKLYLINIKDTIHGFLRGFFCHQLLCWKYEFPFS